MQSSRSNSQAAHPGAMADVAFLLLIFFMVTTVIPQHQGLTLLLPPWQPNVQTQVIHDRNLFRIQINSLDQLLVEGERRGSLEGLREEVKAFVLNRGSDPLLSVSPEKAVVAFKADRGATHSMFIRVLDEVQAAYYELYANQAGVEVSRFLQLDLTRNTDRELYEKGKQGIPMNISISESAMK